MDAVRGSQGLPEDGQGRRQLGDTGMAAFVVSRPRNIVSLLNNLG